MYIRPEETRYNRLLMRYFTKPLVVLLFLCSHFQLRANEGMWLPNRVAEYYGMMQKLGLQLPAEAVYSMNQPSLKDAVVHFGGFCTGEIVSKQGLVFTNHHCGYDAIAGLSTPQANHLRDGYWAKEFSGELPVKDLFVRILYRIEDVTERIIYADNPDEAIKRVVQEARGAGNYHAVVTPVYYGNQYLLWVYEEFRDIRFVGTPPESIGKFGGDTDNWTWPRHTGDFSVFRIYASPDNKPAPYAAENVPYRPRHHFPISLKGVGEKDFSMILGFPGRTTRYLPPAALQFKVNDEYPVRAEVYARRIRRMKEEMEKSEVVRLNLASTEARLANGQKYFRGVIEAFKDPEVGSPANQLAFAYMEWAKAGADRAAYATLVDDFRKLYSEYHHFLMQELYLTQTVGATLPMIVGSRIRPWFELATAEEKDAEKIATALTKAREASLPIFEKSHSVTNQKVFAEMVRIVVQALPPDKLPTTLNRQALSKLKAAKTGDIYDALAQEIFQKSILTDSIRLARFWAKPNAKTMEKDLGFQMYLSYHNLMLPLSKNLNFFRKQENDLLKTWMAGLMKFQSDKAFYPDANSTLRLSFGTARAYTGPEAKAYTYITSHEGILEKENPENPEFLVPANQKQALVARDFGRYADKKGFLPVNFLTDHDITGGNSGSPVINGKGELVGIAFDGNWEGMAGDLVFDDRVKRTINVDIRYVLFCMDKLGGANRLIQELTIAP